MSLFGDKNINIDSLKRWLRTLSVDDITQVDIGGQQIDLTPESKKILKAQLTSFSELVQMLGSRSDWRDLQGILSPMFYNAFFRSKNNAIHIANYYECFVVPSNMKTHKKIIKGFDYQSIGSVRIFDGDKPIAEIGQKSDLLWSVFHDYFINEGEWGEVIHTHTNHEKYLSLQLFEVEGLSLEEIETIIQEILLRVSMEHDMDFTATEIDPIYKFEGENNIYISQFHTVEYERIPTLYLNNALQSKDIRLSYLSYYQVLEYFFVRVQNMNLLNDLSLLSTSTLDHNELRKTLQKYKNSLSERESLKQVLKASVDLSKLKNWINQNANRINTYCCSDENAIDLSKSDEKIISKLSDRIYKFRCSIAHAKGDVDEYIAIPTISESDIFNELELMRYLSYEVLIACSKL